MRRELTGYTLALLISGILCLGFAVFAEASTYYVDAVNGNDNYDGLAQQYDGTHGPWKTLTRVNSQALLGGDSVLFKKDQAWHGELIPNVTGNYNVEVTIGAYGQGSERPVLNGAERVTSSWTKFNGHYDGEYISYLNGPPVYFTTGVSSAAQVFVDGARMSIARHPNPKGSAYQTSYDEDGYFTIGSNPNSTSCRSKYSQDSLSFLGSYKRRNTQIYIRLSDWYVERRGVTNYNATSGVVTWAPAATSTVKSNYGFFFTNNLPLLDLPGEWWHDPETGYLFVWMPENDHPGNHEIYVSKHSHAITLLDGNAKLRVENLIIKNYADIGIYLSNKSATIINTDVLYSNEQGIYSVSNYTNTIHIEDCLIEGSNASGIGLDYSGDVMIINNEIMRNGHISTQENPGQKLYGIRVGGYANVSILGNIIKYTGYAAIAATPTPETSSLEISNNNIAEYCLDLDDCGGIYLNGGLQNSTPALSRITDNVIQWGRSNNDGTPFNSQIIKSKAVGIYLDNYLSNSRVEGNSIIGAWSDLGAIFIHAGNNNVIHDNTVRQWGYPTFGVSELNIGNNPLVKPMTGNQVYANIFYMETGSNVNLNRFWRSDQNPNAPNAGEHFGLFYNNYYYNPYAPVVVDDPDPDNRVWGAIKEYVFNPSSGAIINSWFNAWSENTIQKAPLFY